MKFRSFLHRALPNLRKSHGDAQDRFVSVVPGNSKFEVRNAWGDDNFGRQSTGEPDPMEQALESFFKSEDGFEGAALEPNCSELLQVDAWQRVPVHKLTVEMIKEEMHGKGVKGLDPSLVAEVNRAPKYREEQLPRFHEEMRYKAFNGLDQSVIDSVRHDVAGHEDQLMELKADMHGKAFNALGVFMVEAVKNEVAEHEQPELAEFKDELHGEAVHNLDDSTVQEAWDKLHSEHEQQLNSDFKAEIHGKAFKALNPELFAKVLKQVQLNDKQEVWTWRGPAPRCSTLAYKGVDPVRLEMANVRAKMRIEPDVVEGNPARDQFYGNLKQALDSGALEKVLEEIFFEAEEEELQPPPELKARGPFKPRGMSQRASLSLPGICELDSD